MFGFVSKAKLYFSHYKRLPKLFDGFTAKSFFPESPSKKPLFVKTSDYLYIFFKLRIMPDNYVLYGFDVKKRSEFQEYLGEPWKEPFIRPKIGPLWRNGIILRDKQIFKIVCDHYKLPIPRHYGFMRAGKLDATLSSVLAMIEKYKPKKLVLKPVLGQNGVGIQFFTPEQLEDIVSDQDLHREDYIIEEAIEQHPELNRINPHSVNSVRLITFLCPNGEVELLTGMLRTSASRLAIDNFSLGGIAVGLDLESGRLKSDGYTKFYSSDAIIDNRKATDKNTIKEILSDLQQMQRRFPGRIFKSHPLTDFKFEGFQLPYWQEVVQTAIRAQQVFYHGKAIALDIAITPEGPVILEGNEDWGTAGIQAANGGLLTEKNRKLFSQYGIQFYG